MNLLLSSEYVKHTKALILIATDENTARSDEKNYQILERCIQVLYTKTNPRKITQLGIQSQWFSDVARFQNLKHLEINLILDTLSVLSRYQPPKLRHLAGLTLTCHDDTRGCHLPYSLNSADRILSVVGAVCWLLCAFPEVTSLRVELFGQLHTYVLGPMRWNMLKFWSPYILKVYQWLKMENLEEVVWVYKLNIPIVILPIPVNGIPSGWNQDFQFPGILSITPPGREGMTYVDLLKVFTHRHHEQLKRVTWDGLLDSYAITSDPILFSKVTALSLHDPTKYTFKPQKWLRWDNIIESSAYTTLRSLRLTTEMRKPLRATEWTAMVWLYIRRFQWLTHLDVGNLRPWLPEPSVERSISWLFPSEIEVRVYHIQPPRAMLTPGRHDNTD